VLIGATDYHIVCNLPSMPDPTSRVLPYATTALCLGLLFVFTHVAVVSLLGTSKVEHAAWQRSVGAAKDTIISRLDGIELSLSQVIQSELEPRAEEDAGAEPADDQTAARSANTLTPVLNRWNTAFVKLSTPLKQAAGELGHDFGRGETGDTDKAAALARALSTFNSKIARESTVSGFSEFLDDPTRTENTLSRRHLDTIARDLAALRRTSMAVPVSDGSAGVGALARLGRSLFGGNAGGEGLVSRDYIGMASSLVALLFVLLLQTNRRRFHFRPLPEPPDTLEAGPQTTTREP